MKSWLLIWLRWKVSILLNSQVPCWWFVFVQGLKSALLEKHIRLKSALSAVSWDVNIWWLSERAHSSDQCFRWWTIFDSQLLLGCKRAILLLDKILSYLAHRLFYVTHVPVLAFRVFVVASATRNLVVSCNYGWVNWRNLLFLTFRLEIAVPLALLGGLALYFFLRHVDSC